MNFVFLITKREREKKRNSYYLRLGKRGTLNML